MVINFNNIRECSISQYENKLPIKKVSNITNNVNYLNDKNHIKEKTFTLQYKPSNILSYISTKINKLKHDRIVHYNELRNYIKSIPFHELYILFINEITLQRLKDLGLNDIINSQKNLTFIIDDKFECDTITCIRNDNTDFLFIYHESSRYYDLVELNGIKYNKLLLK
jgi:hypothetical protein